jgi:hypothetical protein
VPHALGGTPVGLKAKRTERRKSHHSNGYTVAAAVPHSCTVCSRRHRHHTAMGARHDGCAEAMQRSCIDTAAPSHLTPNAHGRMNAHVRAPTGGRHSIPKPRTRAYYYRYSGHT